MLITGHNKEFTSCYRDELALGNSQVNFWFALVNLNLNGVNFTANERIFSELAQAMKIN